jgi:hypothetical protein
MRVNHTIVSIVPVYVLLCVCLSPISLLLSVIGEHSVESER